MSENFENLVTNENSDETHPASEILYELPEQATVTNEEVSKVGEETVSPEEWQEILEQETAYQAAKALASHINETDGTSYTPEDLINDQEATTWVSRFIENHPKARKVLMWGLLSTTLAAAPQEAKADAFTNTIINTVAQGFIRQVTTAPQLQQRGQQQKDRANIQHERERMNVPLTKQQIHDTYQQRRDDLRHQAEMRRITDPTERAEADLNYQEAKALRNVDARAGYREQTWENQERAADMNTNVQMQHNGQNIELATTNQIIRQGSQNFLKNILIKH
jgi:hypothetical protein